MHLKDQTKKAASGVASSAVSQSEAAMPAGFVDVGDLIPGLVTDLRYFGTENFVGECIEGYESGRLLATRDAALALREVQHELAECGLALKVFDAYRPQRAVNHFISWANDASDVRRKAEYYPHLDKDQLFPAGYLLEFSSHSRGSTVDLTLIDRGSGVELDMGTPFDFFDPSSWPASLEVGAQQRANRMLLRSMMCRHGFVPVAEEWWHFTLHNEPYPDTWFDFPIR